MTQCNSLNVKLFNSQHNKLKLATKIEIDVTLRLSLNLVGNLMMKLIFHISYS